MRFNDYDIILDKGNMEEKKFMRKLDKMNKKYPHIFMSGEEWLTKSKNDNE